MVRVFNPDKSGYDRETRMFTEENPTKDFQYMVSFMLDDLYMPLPVNHATTLMMVEVSYVPKDFCITAYSFKDYLAFVDDITRFRNEEDLVTRLIQDFIRVVKPVFVEVTGHFNFDGGEKVVKASANVKHEESEPIQQSEAVKKAAKELEELRQQMSPDEFKETLLKNQDLIKILSEEEKKKSESIQKIFELPDESSLEPEED